ncbi:helix-turn-helix domain-containing protein [Rhodovulum sulfidophilum]|nr:helix-turn-helix domain-containing protein [Rhodovulum sulfidophilum]
MVEVSRKTINTVENGVFVPSTTLALRLARCLGVSVEDLFTLSD